MADQSKTNWVKYERVGAILAVIGLVAALLTLIPHSPQGFWADHIRGVRGAGGMLCLIGLIWTALAVAMGRTSFFDADQPLSADRFIISVISIGCASILAIAVTIRALPDTPADKLPPDPKAKARIMMQERNFRIFTAGVLLLAGATIAVIPCRRFLQKGPPRKSD